MAKHFKALLVLIIVLGVSLLIALALATRSTDSFAYNYTTLLYLNIAVIFTMSALLLVLGYWLFQRWRKNVFGTRLLTRFAFSFVLLAVVPSVLLFFISTLFVSRTIDSWFGLKLDSALNAGIDFGRDRLLRTRDLTQEQLARLVTQNPNALNNPNNAEAQAWLQSNGWRTLLGINAQGVITWRIDQTGSDEANITQHLPIFNQDTLSKVGTQWVLIEDDADNLIDPNDTAVPRQYIHAIQALGTSAKTPQTTRWIYAQKVMPSDFSSRVRDIQNGLRDYQATEVSRISLRQLYRVTLGIILLVTLLAALAAAFLIANRMIQPILWLAQATRQVASGHYALVPQRVKGSDEMLQLVDSFGDMAQKLNVTQTTLAHNQHELESAKAYSEAVLDNLSSGVLVFNQNLQLQSFNQTAQRMFHTDLTQYVQQNLRDIEPLSALQSAIENQMQTQSTPETGVQNDSWRIQQSLANPASPHHDDMTLSIQGSRFLAQDETYSWVLVCDDVTPIISAQRTLAWGEVARRLAHEIKNPLTPIQLSAERLNRKLDAELSPESSAFLKRMTHTIIQQVDNLKNMVNAFSQYARAPNLNLQQTDLNALVQEVTELYRMNEGQVQIRLQLDEHLPTLRLDVHRMRQLLVNLIKNALEALEDKRSGGIITLSTQLQPHASQPQAILNVQDNGPGIPLDLLPRLFEPYVTSKHKGTGLGLAIVKKIVEEHSGHLSARNLEPEGAMISIRFPLDVHKPKEQGQ